MHNRTDLIIASLVGGLPAAIADRVDAAESLLHELERRISDVLQGPAEPPPSDPSRFP